MSVKMLTTITSIQFVLTIVGPIESCMRVLDTINGRKGYTILVTLHEVDET